MITKKLDLTSPLFAFSCAAAENIGEVKLILLRQDQPAGGEELTNFTYMTYTLANSLVSSVSVGGSGDIPIETVTLNYSAINWEYKSQLTELNQEDTMPKGWDLAKNAAADAAAAG